MKTTNQNFQSYERNVKRLLLQPFLILVICLSCSKNDESQPTDSQQQSFTAVIKGIVQGQHGEAYPKTVVSISGKQSATTQTNSDGAFSFNSLPAGNYSVTITKPLATTIVSESVVSISLNEGQESTTNFIVAPQVRNGVVVIGDVDIFGEIKDANGNPPISSSEPLYAENVYDEPLGLLTPMMAPDDHHIILSEWEQATGSVVTQCDGNSSSVTITVNGLIPNGTYTFWLNFLNKTKRPGDPLSFVDDVVKIEPLGSGTQNVAIANANGVIAVSIDHNSCILTEETALVMPVIYHLNGLTFGSGHIPDPEEASHMLIYFQ